jgi:hypothetical protein
MDAVFETPVTVVDRTAGDDSGPVAYALAELSDAIADAGVAVETVDHWTETAAETYVVTGTTDSRVVDRLLDADVAEPESVVYEWAETDTGGAALVVAGTDERGLSYALLEIAERVDARGTDALAAVEDTVETPDNRIRGVDRFLETVDRVLRPDGVVYLFVCCLTGAEAVVIGRRDSVRNRSGRRLSTDLDELDLDRDARFGQFCRQSIQQFRIVGSWRSTDRHEDGDTERDWSLDQIGTSYG